ncbi:hypothetical protein PHYPO_G00175020 [Pangasianodon hypophthalmus]|uniref:Uncharacterized protein n=1 Tax=Pangasianodon hypophthalmus TaxID=310915 RepID=A0A5N5PP91_PANHP|nr:hypothetical protein PHYPO_G00175020 [Pangasianodon hypophthalmus]
MRASGRSLRLAVANHVTSAALAAPLPFSCIPPPVALEWRKQIRSARVNASCSGRRRRRSAGYPGPLLAPFPALLAFVFV